MAPRWYFETTTTGKHVSIKRSRSHLHNHHRHRHEHESYLISRDEWKRIIERERYLEGANKSMASEVDALRSALATTQAEASHLRRHVVPQLQDSVKALRDENDRLRRSLDSAGNTWSRLSRQEEELKRSIETLERQKRELEIAKIDLQKTHCSADNKGTGVDEEEKEDLRRDIAELRGENASLKSRLMTLSRQAGDSCGRRLSHLFGDADYWKDQCRYWKTKFENEALRSDDTRSMLEIRTEKMKAYEELLKGRNLI